MSTHKRVVIWNITWSRWPFQSDNKMGRKIKTELNKESIEMGDKRRKNRKFICIIMVNWILCCFLQTFRHLDFGLHPEHVMQNLNGLYFRMMHKPSLMARQIRLGQLPLPDYRTFSRIWYHLIPNYLPTLWTTHLLWTSHGSQVHLGLLIFRTIAFQFLAQIFSAATFSIGSQQ